MTLERRPLPQHRAVRNKTIVGRGLLLGVVLLVSARVTVNGQEQAPPTVVTDEVKGAEAKGTGAEGSGASDAEMEGTEVVPAKTPAVTFKTADDEEARRRAFSTGVVMLGCILICGVALIAIVLLWGNRARRIARQALPKVAPRDELWYLKHKVESDLERPRDPDKDNDSSTEPRA